jgi:hypothetical protein
MDARLDAGFVEFAEEAPTASHPPEQWSAEECELMLGIAAQCERRLQQTEGS